MRNVLDWQVLQDEFYRISQMSCKPSFTKVPGDYVTDENRSVKWNREQVQKNHEAYEKEVARLNTEKNKARDELYEHIYAAIQREVGHSLSRKSAMALWNYAYTEGHSGGMPGIRTHLNDVMALTVKILENEVKV